MAFTLPDLPYHYYSQEPHVDAVTMNIHHTKHHQVGAASSRSVHMPAVIVQRWWVRALHLSRFPCAHVAGYIHVSVPAAASRRTHVPCVFPVCDAAHTVRVPHPLTTAPM